MGRMAALWWFVTVMTLGLVLGGQASPLTDNEERELEQLITDFLESEKRSDVPSFGDAPIYKPSDIIKEARKRGEDPFMSFGGDDKRDDSEKRSFEEFGDAPIYKPSDLIKEAAKRGEDPFMSFGGGDKRDEEDTEDSKREDKTEDKRDDAPFMSFGDRGEEMDIYSNLIEGAKRVLDEPATVEKRGDNYHINMCYFCDATCLATMQQPAQGAVSYLQQVTNGIQDRIRTLMGPSTTVAMQGYLLKFPMPAQTYLLFKSGAFKGHGVELLANIATNFWKVWVPPRHTGRKPLFDFVTRQGCDANFLIVSRQDDLWSESNAGDIDGEASSMGMCSKYAFGVIKLNNDPVQMATLASHELGHLLGLSHDGPLEPGWASNCQKFPGMPVCTPLINNCKGGADLPCSGNCVMNEAVGTEATFSDCSKAYWAGMQLLTNVMPNTFSLKCIKA